jgi:translation initiation factor eIF-2B subunit epsilon
LLYLTLTLLFISGDNASDLELSDDSDSSDEESESSEDTDDNILHLGSYPSSSATSLPTSTLNFKSQDSVAESEFQNEVIQSLERAFAEGHSIDNAAVELKTLRMASNVPLSKVRAAVVGAIVEQIKIVDGGTVPQRNEIARVIDRWGGLINKIGGVEAVETIADLQVSPLGHASLHSNCIFFSFSDTLRIIAKTASFWTNTCSIISRRYC